MDQLLPNQYLLTAGIVLLSYILLLGIKRLFSTRIAKFFGKPHNRWDDIVADTFAHTGHLFMLGTSFYIGFHFIPEYEKYSHHANRIYFIIIMWQIMLWGNHLLNKWIENFLTQRMKKNPAAASSISLVQLFAKITFFAVIFLFTLHNLGIQITTIVAGLGVGGIAVALALQKILGDLFSSLSIVLDKPFMVGDFIVFDNYMGEVEKIGLKTTRLKSLSGEQIIASNSDLLATRIRNYRRMRERRVILNLSLMPQKNAEMMKRAVSLVQSAIGSKEKIRFDRCHFMKINSSFDIEAVYWVLSSDYNLHMDIQQQILLEVCESFEREGLSFALPMQTVNVNPTEIWMKNDSFIPKMDESQKSLS